jgi:hypothetical protein
VIVRRTIIGLLIGVPAIAIAMIVGWIFLFFNAGALYAGDGEYLKGDGDRIEATFRVEFTAIDLTKPGRSTFTFTRLGPWIPFHAGICILNGDGKPIAVDEYGRPDLPEEQRPSPRIRMSLDSEDGRVFSQIRSLDEWNWLRNFAQIHGRIAEYQDREGNTRFRRVDPVGLDDGYSTSFTPRWFGNYTLVVEVIDPDPKASSIIAVPVMEAYTASP